MIPGILDDLTSTFREALLDLIVVAVRGGFLFWGVFMGRLLTGFFEWPSVRKIVLISMPIAVLIATFFAFYSFKWVVNPGETRAEAIHDAQRTFLFVLVPLWSGCIWGAIKLKPDAAEPNDRDA